MKDPRRRLEIEDNVEAEPHVGMRVKELREFLSHVPDDALIVWSSVKPGHRLLVDLTSNQKTLFISEATS